MFEQYDTPVRCAAGHLFTTIWMPLASLKAVRLSGRRYQRCPVGHHWTTVEPLDAVTADPSDLAAAGKVHDMRIP
jgi:hypothetical protein